MSHWQLLDRYCGWPLLAALALPYLLALLRGDATGRALAHLVMIGAVVDTFLPLGSPGASIVPVYPIQLAIDALLLVGQVVVTLRSRWLYPIVIAATQLLIVCADAIGAAGLIAQPATAFWLVVAPSTIQLAAVSYGLIRHRVRRRSKIIESTSGSQTGQLA